MTTVQHFLAWVREKSKKNRNLNHDSSFLSSTLSMESSSVDPSMKTYVKHRDVDGSMLTLASDGLPRTPDLMEMLQESGMTLQEKEAFVNEVRRRAPYRASMKLPAIPREDQRTLMTTRTKREQESPCHVYEEIPAYALDSDGDFRYTDDISDPNADSQCALTKLDYHGSDQGLNNGLKTLPINVNSINRNGAHMNNSIRQHQMLSDSQRQSQRGFEQSHFMKQHQDTIERHRKTVQQYREAMPTPVFTDDDPNVLSSDRFYPEDIVSSDSAFLSSPLNDATRSSQSAFSPFTPRSSEEGTQHCLPTKSTNNADNDKCIKSPTSTFSTSAPSPADCKTQLDSITGNVGFRRLPGISHSFNDSKCARPRECDTEQGAKELGDTKLSDKCDSDNRVNESGKETHVHCKRCRRPHGMYHGTMIEHCVHNMESTDNNIDNCTGTDVKITDKISDTHEDTCGANITGFVELPICTTDACDKDSSSSTLHKMSPLTRCNSSPAPLNLPLTVATPEKDRNGSLTVPQTLSTPKTGSSRILTNGSLGSNRSGVSNDTPSSPNDSCNSAKSRLSMSSSDSGNSSIYTFSGSEKDSTLLRGSKIKENETTIEETSETPAIESDCSNDTFSEYDMQSGETSPCVGSDEYTNYLSKINKNHWFKIDVKRVIRESESSEYESSSDVAAFLMMRDGLDSSSLTTVTSMSDLSVLDLEGLPQGHSKRFSRTAANRRRVRFARVISSDESDAKSSDAKSKPGSRLENKRYIRRKSAMKSSDKTELYCLPEFTTGVCEDEHDEQFTDFDRLERLSCRATAFNPTATNQATGSGMTSPSMSPTVGLLATNTVPSRRGQNKLLSDLMKRNHDRQLFML